MAKPNQLPEWDTSETNVVTTTAGHATSGFITDEIPSSKEENFWRNLIYKWFQWLVEPTLVLNVLETHGLAHIAAGSAGSIYPVFDETTGAISNEAAQVGFLGILPLQNLRVGAVLEEFRFRVQDAAGETWTAKLYETQDGVRTELATATSDGSGSVQTLTLDANSTTIETGKGYYLAFTMSVTTTAKFLYSAEVDIT